MHPASTLFFDVCAQRDFWLGGAWPLVSAEEARNVAHLFALAAALHIRQGGIVCLHASAADAPATVPPHCLAGSPGAARASACVPPLPLAICPAATEDAPLPLDRAHAFYVSSGCMAAPDASPQQRRVFDHLTAGVRDGVVFGAGIEYAMDRAIDGLLRRRVRAHVVLDAAGAADPSEAQRVIAAWKRRAVDGATTATVLHLLTRASRQQV